MVNFDPLDQTLLVEEVSARQSHSLVIHHICADGTIWCFFATTCFLLFVVFWFDLDFSKIVDGLLTGRSLTGPRAFVSQGSHEMVDGLE